MQIQFIMLISVYIFVLYYRLIASFLFSLILLILLIIYLITIYCDFPLQSWNCEVIF